MNKFNFRFDTVLKWRDNQTQIEELKLDDLLQERTSIREQLENSLHEREDVEAQIRSTSDTRGRDLGALSAYQRAQDLVAARIAGKLANLDSAITEQRQTVMSARQNARLLDRLKTRDKDLWQANLARQEETTASELFLASTVRNRTS